MKPHYVTTETVFAVLSTRTSEVKLSYTTASLQQVVIHSVAQKHFSSVEAFQHEGMNPAPHCSLCHPAAHVEQLWFTPIAQTCVCVCVSLYCMSVCMCDIVTTTRADQSTRLELTMMKCLVSAANRGSCTCPLSNGKLLHPNQQPEALCAGRWV